MPSYGFEWRPRGAGIDYDDPKVRRIIDDAIRRQEAYLYAQFGGEPPGQRISPDGAIELRRQADGSFAVPRRLGP